MSLPPSYNLLTKYPNKYYLETGIYRGDSLQLAIDAGFEHVYGIELFREHIDFCYSRFDLANYPERLKLIRGDSSECLWSVIENINEPITFFLDSHSQLLEGEPEINNPFPLLHELVQISRHSIKIHTIIIDDILHLTHPDVTGWSRNNIENSIRRINPAYQFQYLANPVKNNLLVATV